jgi:hypothetical protein
MTYVSTEMWELLGRVPVSGLRCRCHEPRVFGHQVGCIPGRSEGAKRHQRERQAQS